MRQAARLLLVCPTTGPRCRMTADNAVRSRVRTARPPSPPAYARRRRPRLLLFPRRHLEVIERPAQFRCDLVEHFGWDVKAEMGVTRKCSLSGPSSKSQRRQWAGGVVGQS